VQQAQQRDHSEDQGIDGRVGSEWILWRLSGCVCGLVVCFCEHADEPSGCGAVDLVRKYALG
jgi:hypothetical protein